MPTPPLTTPWVPMWPAPAAPAGAALPADTVVAAGTRIIANKLLAGDAQAAWRVNGNGTMVWGLGGSSAPDVYLYRSSGMLATDNIFKTTVAGKGAIRIEDAAGGIRFGSDVDLYRLGADVLATDDEFRSTRATVTGIALAAIVTGDTNYRFRAQAGGTLEWGSGAANPDTNLYRSAAGMLKTDGALTVVGRGYGLSWIASPGTANEIAVWSDGHIYWGSASDTNLYRSGAGVLKTDGTLIRQARIATVSFNTAQSHTSAGNWQRINFDVSFTDIGGIWNSGTPTRLTAPVTGYYAIAGRVTFNAMPNYFGVQIRFKDGTILAQSLLTAPSAGAISTAQVYDTFNFVAGDYIEMWGYQSQGSVPYAGGLPGCRLTMHLIEAT